MKKLLLALGLTFFGAVAVQSTYAQTVEQPASQAAIDFEKLVHDYGTMDQYGDGTCEFKFTNTGKQPLIISNAKGSCGCTVPNWPREPIAPGATAAIKVKYDTKRVGPINKSVTVTTNAGVKTLRIKGVIKAKPAGGAPVNDSGAPTVK